MNDINDAQLSKLLALEKKVVDFRKEINYWGGADFGGEKHHPGGFYGPLIISFLYLHRKVKSKEVLNGLYVTHKDLFNYSDFSRLDSGNYRFNYMIYTQIGMLRKKGLIRATTIKNKKSDELELTEKGVAEARKIIAKRINEKMGTSK